MTYEEAIPYLECGAVPSCCCSSNKRHGGDCEGEEKVIEAINLAIEALEKQIPSKCKKFKDTCSCGHTVYPHMDYCDKCGQALNWSDEK